MDKKPWRERLRLMVPYLAHFVGGTGKNDRLLPIHVSTRTLGGAMGFEHEPNLTHAHHLALVEGRLFECG